ncbi:MAG: hypothetical protein MR210_02310 [Erysipelotrichaceae bacterium]|nr:hypothetical protein [Erysipelotrichaceae bacterium]
MFKDEHNQLKGINCVILGLFIMIVINSIVGIGTNGILAVIFKDVTNGLQPDDILMIDMIALGRGALLSIANILGPLLTWKQYLKQDIKAMGIKPFNIQQALLGALSAAMIVLLPYLYALFLHPQAIIKGEMDVMTVALILMSSINSATSVYFGKGYLMGCMRNTHKFWLVLLIPVLVEIVFYQTGVALLAINILTSLACGLMYMKTNDLSGALAFRLVFSLLSGLLALNSYDVYIMVMECVLCVGVCLYYYDGKHSKLMMEED